jgi:Ca-activated chloride channel family protein
MKSLDFLASERLWLLPVVAALGLVYAALQRRNKRYEVRFTNLALLDVVAPKRPGWRRHATAVAFLLSAATLVVAFAQPTRDVRVPKQRATVVLALDTSLSMEATDVAPSRIEAAQQAADAFLDVVPEFMNVGLVTFDGVARLRVTPTTDRAAVRSAIENIELNASTAIGEAIYASLDAVAAAPLGEDGEPAPASIVLMSDGKTTIGRPNEDAAAAAEEAGVPVATIAFGTPFGEIRVENDPAPVPVPVEPEPLRTIARQTGGTFFEADSLEGLEDVYTDIGTSIGFDVEKREVSAWFVGVGLALLLLTATLSLLWFARLP